MSKCDRRFVENNKNCKNKPGYHSYTGNMKEIEKSSIILENFKRFYPVSDHRKQIDSYPKIEHFWSEYALFYVFWLITVSLINVIQYSLSQNTKLNRAENQVLTNTKQEVPLRRYNVTNKLMPGTLVLRNTYIFIYI